MTVLKFGVLISLIISLVFLTAQVMQTLSFGRRRLHSESEGSRRKGIAYAFGRGMLPREKESAAKHLPTYIAGTIYHAGIFTAILSALLLAIGVSPPKAVVPVFQFLLAPGFLSGAGLFLKRAVFPRMRYISCPDDYISNLLVDAFVLSGLLSSRHVAAAPVFLILSILTFIYAPLGKIRHCFFFFYSRMAFGSYFGRRGVLPRRREAKA